MTTLSKVKSCNKCTEPRAHNTSYCRIHFNEKQREKRKVNKNKPTRKYEKTINGFLMRVYRNMESRVTGIQWKKAHIYEGLDLLPREQFYDWAKNDSTFNLLYVNWKKSGYNRKITPSINRIDSLLGYLYGNIEWITHSENSRLGAVSKYENVASRRHTTTKI